MTHDNTATQLEPDCQDDVPDRIVATAVALWGEQGTNAVSLRAILRKAGVLNEAAIRYYFKDKYGLLGAAFASVAAQFQPLMEEAWSEIDSDMIGKPRVREVVYAVSAAFTILLNQNAPAVQLVARMIREEGETGQDLLLEHFGTVIWQFEEQLAAALPDKSRRALRLHSFLAINSIVNGMVDQGLLWRLPGVAPNEGRFHLNDTELSKGFVEYVVGGLCAQSSIT